MRFPDRHTNALRISRYVRLIDVTPTILDYVGIEHTSGFEGITLLPLLEGEDLPPAETGQFMEPRICFSEAMRRTNMVKSITAYPYKLIEDIGSGDRSLFNLETDPSEQDNIAAASPGATARLAKSLVEVVLGTSSTWFVQLGAGGESHVFDLRIVPEKGPARTGIRIFRFLDADGAVINPEKAADIAIDEGLAVKGLEMQGTICLAFQTEVPNFPVKFDLLVDGARAVDRVFLGTSLSVPENLPLSQRPNRPIVRASRRPEAIPDPPIFISGIRQVSNPYAPSPG